MSKSTESAKLTSYLQTKFGKIYLGDSLNVLQEVIKPESIDL